MVRNICCIIFICHMRQLLLLQRTYKKLQKQTDVTKKGQSSVSDLLQVLLHTSVKFNTPCAHTISLLIIPCISYHVTNKETLNRIAQEDKSKLTSQIFCNSFSIYHSCAKTFGSTVLCRGQDALKLNSHLIIYTDLNTRQGVWETLRPVYYLKKWI